MKMKGGFNKKMNGGCMSTVMTCVMVVLLLVILGLLYYSFVHKESQPVMAVPTKAMKIEHFADGGDVDLTPNGDETVVALYSASWCPHCQDYKPMWGKMKGSGVATTQSGKKVRFVDVDCSDGAHASCEKYEVKGYPTVVAITASGHKQLSRPTTMEELEAEL